MSQQGNPRYELPEQPACELGYTQEQVERLVGADDEKAFNRWLGGPDHPRAECRGSHFDYRLKQTVGCAEPHGTVVYTEDFWRYLAGYPTLISTGS